MAQVFKLLLTTGTNVLTSTKVTKLKHATDRSSLKLTLEELSRANFRERKLSALLAVRGVIQCCPKATQDLIAGVKMSKTDKSVGRTHHQDVKIQLLIQFIQREMRER